MQSINVGNVINMLAITFQIASITRTPINSVETELHNEIRDTIKKFRLYFRMAPVADRHEVWGKGWGGGVDPKSKIVSSGIY